MVSIEHIQKIFRGHIAVNEPLKKYTSFQIGGPADYYFEPADKDDVVEILSHLSLQKIPYMMMGRGSNMLVSDEGIRGAVLNLESESAVFGSMAISYAWKRASDSRGLSISASNMISPEWRCSPEFPER